ncbi:hypothetical protein H2248_001843 [Termitomyces sp. 'cryptogamus']|nr:hypothetical protein H2248_001843 [Termitomyces sp. 'cryptogamus']
MPGVVGITRFINDSEYSEDTIGNRDYYYYVSGLDVSEDSDGTRSSSVDGDEDFEDVESSSVDGDELPCKPGVVLMTRFIDNSEHFEDTTSDSDSDYISESDSDVSCSSGELETIDSISVGSLEDLLECSYDDDYNSEQDE